MKKTILLAFAIAGFSLWMGSGIEVTDASAPNAGSHEMNVGTHAGFIDQLVPGFFREVTAYNVGRPEQTSSRPCIGASGKNLCRLVRQGLKICAANFVDTETILNIEGYGECIVLDRLNRRFSHRVDIAMNKDEVDRAIEFGVQRRYVEVKPDLSLNRR